MIIGSRIVKKTDRERRLTEISKGVFVAQHVDETLGSSDYFEESPILDILLQTTASEKEKDVS
jgi:hypothetical protein